jgi:hypothetical protein
MVKIKRRREISPDLNVIPVAMFCDSSACNRGTPSPITAGSTLLKVPWLEILPPDTNV